MFKGLIDFFSILSIFDWVTPALGIADRVAHGEPFNLGRVWAFNIPLAEAASNGWSSGDIASLLGTNGVDMWGGFYNFGCYSFQVPIEQAAWAEYCMSYYGIPIHPRSQGAPQVGG